MFLRKQKDFARSRHSLQTCTDRNRSQVNKTTTFESRSPSPNQPDQGDKIWSRNVFIYSTKICPRYKCQFLFMAPTSEKLRGFAINVVFNPPFSSDKINKWLGQNKVNFFLWFSTHPKSHFLSFISFSQCSHCFAPGGNDFSRVRMWAVVDIIRATRNDVLSQLFIPLIVFLISF